MQFAARAIDAVRSVAAEEILPRFRSVASDPAGASQPRRKDDGSVVTEADLAAQHALVRRLRAIEALPVMAEEMPSHEQAAVFARGGRFWCLDPLDGSKNFSEAIPFFAVSVALMQDAQPLFGAVYDPIADEAFFAVRGAGAWLNSRPLALPPRGPALAAAVAEVSLRRAQAARALREAADQRLFGAFLVPPRRRAHRRAAAFGTEDVGLVGGLAHPRRGGRRALGAGARRLLAGPALEPLRDRRAHRAAAGRMARVDPQRARRA